MENRINVVELLRDCPTGMELDSPMYDNLYFDKVEEDYRLPISCYTMYHCSKTSVYFTEFGSYNTHKTAKCVIFPKGKTTWEGFVPPCKYKFKEGDVLTTDLVHFIFKSQDNRDCYMHCYYAVVSNNFSTSDTAIVDSMYVHPATKEQRYILFQKMKEAGYEWNAETKTLEKLVVPKFKVGNKITNGKISITIGYIDDEYYYEVGRNIATRLSIKNQDEWNLVPDKFNINTLKPFESKVLVRDSDTGVWRVSFWGCLLYNQPGYIYDTIRGSYKQCIPYEGNEYLLGKTEECQDFYKIWE